MPLPLTKPTNDATRDPVPLTEDEVAAYENFLTSSRHRFQVVFRGTQRLHGFCKSNNKDDHGFNYSRLFFFGEKARQAVRQGREVSAGDAMHFQRINLGRTNEEEILRLIRELNKIIPTLSSAERKSLSAIPEDDTRARFREWDKTTRLHFRNTLLFMFHKLGATFKNPVYPSSLLVSTTTRRYRAEKFGQGAEGKAARHIVMEYWLPKDYRNVAVVATDLQGFDGLLPHKGVYEEENEIAVIGALFPHSIIQVDEYSGKSLERTVVNPHLLNQLAMDPNFKLHPDARIPFNQDHFYELLATETNYGYAYLSWSNQWVHNEQIT